ncbi:Ferrous iron transport protein B [Methylacidimicrobium cyclopophantes]|uniref:Ferrous iron transport protein B n=1 Tax=Methylacidimicrobium cyclopophantes TaxID=1041766 RepID=A0A5E6M798_9BACT|nr:ferrous iron transport protein B [Methylacidimicrobium cyclopophantes]VVM05242.1 Ferrous iron transport protein B [Methylacidimicrobium cyclopophantes]
MKLAPGGRERARLAEPTNIAFVGNPNSGKSTLFNALTGLRQKVANYPGVTIEKKIGFCYDLHGRKCQLIDLPGTYSLLPSAPDEEITCEVLFGMRPDTPVPDAVICVLDATHLERSLYLVTQVLDLGLPIIVALNMMDLLEERGDSIDVEALAAKLGCPVIPCQASKRKGLIEIRAALSRELSPSRPICRRLPEPVGDALTRIARDFPQEKVERRALCSLVLSAPDSQRLAELLAVTHLLPSLREEQERLQEKMPDWRQQSIAMRQQEIRALTADVFRKSPVIGKSATDWLDRWVTHPFWGWWIFLGIMGTMFLAVFEMGAGPKDAINGLFLALAVGIKKVLPAGDLRDLLTEGVIGGAGNVVVFLPQILVLFFFLGLLEDSGYMARAAFLMDKVMSRVGLQGRAFIPLLASHACAIPGILAARTLSDPRDRMVTILVAPFASCSARLPVYVLLIAAFFGGRPGAAVAEAGIVMFLYLLGLGAAFGFAWLFKNSLFRSRPTPLVLELPPYRRPSLRTIAAQMGSRAGAFLRRAGTTIVAISVILWWLTAYPKVSDGDRSAQLAGSFAGRIGHCIEPAIRPLGFNWKIGIGLISAQAARENFVSTIGVLYAGVSKGDAQPVSLAQALLADRWPDGRPVFSPLVCLTIMLFFVFSLQCVSTVVAVRRETGSWKWALFQFGYMTLFAYVVCLAVYQIGRAFGF